MGFSSQNIHRNRQADNEKQNARQPIGPTRQPLRCEECCRTDGQLNQEQQKNRFSDENAEFQADVAHHQKGVEQACDQKRDARARQSEIDVADNR